MRAPLFILVLSSALPLAAQEDRRDRLRAARTWMYQIQGLDEDGAVNAARVYRDAAEAGLRPLVTRVSLSRLTPTPPPRPARDE